MSSSLRRVAAAVAVLVAAAVVAAAWSSTGEARPAAQAGPVAGAAAWPPKAGWKAGKQVCPAQRGGTVGFLQPLADPNYQLIYSIIKRDLGKSGIKTRIAVANLNPGKQIADINSMVQAGVKALIVAAVDPRAIQGALAQARKKGVKIVVTDVFVGGGYVTNVATSPYDAGQLGAQFLRKAVGDGRVAAIEGPSFAGEVLVQRNRGFGVGAAGFKVNVVEKQTNVKISPDGARAIVEGWKQKYGPDLKGIWAFNDLSALGAASALGAGFNPVIVGLNGEPPAIELVRAGRIGATVDLQPAAIGHALAFATASGLCGKALPKTLWVPVRLIDKTTVARWTPWGKLPAQAYTVKVAKQKGKFFVIPTYR